MNRQATIDYWKRRLHSPFSPDDSAPEKVHQFDTDDGYTFLLHDHAGITVDIEEQDIFRDCTSSVKKFFIPSSPRSITVRCENPDLFLIIDPNEQLIESWHCKLELLKREIEKSYRHNIECACEYVSNQFTTLQDA